MFGSPRQVEAGLAGVDQRVAQRGQFYGTHVCLARKLGLAAMVGWREKQRETKHERMRLNIKRGEEEGEGGRRIQQRKKKGG